MKTPAFWAKNGLRARALAPLGILTQTLTARRMAKPGFAAGMPVFCAGNAGSGGAGKTIFCRDILPRLPGRPFALTRGYGGRLAGPVLVDLNIHNAADVGDEALLLAQTAPTILAYNRAAGARLALQLGATAIVMDDGLQNPGLVKTAAFLIIDGGYGFGNGYLLPAGPLREKISSAAARCVAAVLIGQDATDALAQLPRGLPVLRADLTPHCAMPLAGKRVVAFAGIGRPEKFFDSAGRLGAVFCQKIPFADHHVYTPADATKLRAAAAHHNAQLITTEKDMVKLPASLRAQCAVVTVSLNWQNLSEISALLQKFY